MIVTLADQHLAQNAGRRYPLADDTTGIEDNAILDCRITVTGVTDIVAPVATIVDVGERTAGSVRATVVVTPTPISVDDTVTVSGYSVIIKDGVTSEIKTQIALAFFEIPKTMSRLTPYVARFSGYHVHGEMTVTDAILTETITPDQRVAFARSTVVCDTLKVESIQSAESIIEFGAASGISSSTEVLTGRVVLDEGYNTEPYLDDNRLKLDITKGGGRGEKCQDEITEGQVCGNVMFSINGERPGSSGDIKIVGEGGVSVKPVPADHAIEISLNSEAANTMSNQCEASC